MSTTLRLRPSVLAARETVAERLEGIKRLHVSGLASGQTCARLSSMVDAVIVSLFEAALADLPGGGESLRERVALVAIGGYGRRQQAPCSDVDLMVLYVGPLDQEITEFTQRITQDLCDARLQPGHSLREPTEAVKLARSDTVICTSLIEARLIIGALAPFEEFQKQFRQMVERRQATLCKEFIEARRLERAKFGGTVYLLEPNIKRSPGGLRDIHLLRWLWFAKTGESDPNRLLNQGVISKFDHRRLMSSLGFLQQVRNEMHFGASGASDVLDRAEQMRIAESLRIRAREGLLPVEQLMRDYFSHTSHVSFLSGRLSDLVSPPPAMTRVLDPLLAQSVSREYRVGLREVSATQLGVTKLSNKLDEAVRLLDLGRLHGKRIASETWYHVYRSSPSYSSDLEPATIARFRDLLANPQGLGDLLRRMHELAVLEKIIPHFSHARYLLQFNRYHKYTVDEHCIRSVAEATKLGDRDDLVGETYRKLKRKWLLHLALLLHDLGKGFTEDHSIVGERIAREIGPRLELSADDTNLLASLVRDHLEMSHTGLRHDTSSPEFVRQFADKVGNPERLDMLYLLTMADLAAVGPGVLNDWKVEVLSELYYRARKLLAPDNDPIEGRSRKQVKERVWKQLPAEGSDDEWFDNHFRSLPESYVMSHEPSELASALLRIKALEGREGTAWGHYLPGSKTIEFVAAVGEGSGRGIFAAMAGVLSSQGMSILAAETALLASDVVLFRYHVDDSQASGETAARRIDDIAQAMVDWIDSTDPPTFRRVWGSEQAEASRSLTEMPIDVKLNETVSQDYLVIEVFAFDRLGLLYDLARTLHELELNIRFAKIGTNLDQIVDVFYVTERDHTKPGGERRLREIHDKLAAQVEQTVGT